MASDGGMRLDGRGLRRFLAQYSRRLNTAVHHPYAGRPLTYQRAFELQARLLAKTILGELDNYPPLRVR